MPFLALLLAATMLSGASLFVLAVIMGHPPLWLVKYELLVFAFGALTYGFTGYLPPLLYWLRCRPIRGGAFLLIGAVAMYVPSNIVISCIFIGVGIRLIWQTACDLTRRHTATGTTIVHPQHDTVPARNRP